MMAGQLLASRYELGDRLGVGGMSTVQLAFDRRLERHVAVKLLAEHLAEDQLFVSRFRREALAAARLVHPNIVQVFDFGLDEGTGRHYIVMEYIRGQSGAEILRERGRLPVDEALEIVTQSCRGLDYAHRNGVVHRDVKPGNLLRSDDDVVKLADFGIAKAVSDESSITQIGSVLGTASYLAPEQARGEEAGPQADLYALGVVTYQLLSGRLPYEAASLTELALKQQREAPAWLHELDPAIPEPLAVAIDRALALDPAERPSTAEEFRIALEEGARGIGVDATSATRVVPADPADTAATRVAAVPAPAPATRPEVAPRVPRQPRGPRTGAQAPVPAGRRTPPPAVRPKRRKGGIRRFFTLLLVALLLAAGALIAVVATSANQKSVQLRKVTGDQVQTIVQQVKDLVDANTR
jgi:serine/threonine protein kinase